MFTFKQYYFDDFTLGEEFPIPSRTMTEALFAAFQLASADNHPSHYDVEYCRKRGMPNLGAHGFQILIQSAAGAGWFPHYVEDSMKGFIEQSSKFLKPVYVGDTLYPSLKISKLDCGKTTGVVTLESTILNQREELVMEGEQKYLIKRHSSCYA
jgi:acyl dehydratase